MRAGALNERIVIMDLVRGSDGVGGSTKAYEARLTLWANVKKEAEKRTITIRHRKDVASGQFVLHDGRIYEITDTSDSSGRRREMKLECEEL